MEGTQVEGRVEGQGGYLYVGMMHTFLFFSSNYVGVCRRPENVTKVIKDPSLKYKKKQNKNMHRTNHIPSLPC